MNGRDQKGRFIKGHKFTPDHTGSIGYWRNKKRPDMAEKHKGMGNPMWKGDAIGKGGMHLWLRRNFEQTRLCEDCGAKDKSVYDWALLAGKDYERKRENYRRLCRSCHQKYDFKHGMRTPTIHSPETIERIRQSRIANRLRKQSNGLA